MHDKAKILVGAAILAGLLGACDATTEGPETVPEPAPTTSQPATETLGSGPVDSEVEAAGADDESLADAGTQTDTIPSRFHGLWAESVDRCGFRGHQRFDISADRIGFFESTGIVQDVRVDGDYAAVTISEQYGDAPPAEYVFYMAIEDENTMRVRYDDRSRFRIYRCP